MPVNLSIDDSIAILTLDNPYKLNALSSDFMRDISEKICDVDQRAKVLVVVGCKKAFAAGVDISEIESHSAESACLKSFIDYSWESVFHVKIPVIAAVSGYALGGGFELALMCDIIIAAESAKFGFPEVNLGLMPGMGGTQLLAGIVGPKLAAEIIMTGDFLSAQTAKDLKIASRVVGDDELMAQTLELAKKIASKPPISLRTIKDSIRLSQNVGLNQGMQTERQIFRSLFSTADKKERVAQFLKK
ncbi:MAG: enoyl-CoA hydratase/isomerase family protein [Holosporaceae bacterium]|jgi:enoyl-CoA hydratase/carnithine racemase|nr:enoyl-CoA hydratase/isomerase family protein [Holosporaceae bacterium]